VNPRFERMAKAGPRLIAAPKSAYPSQVVEAPDSALRDVLAYMEANFDKSVRLAELAEMSALSVSRFATVFRQRIGLSPYKYLCRVRVRRAQLLLLAGVPGAVVAAEVGFFDQSHLARHFKRFCGVTPTEFLQQARA